MDDPLLTRIRVNRFNADTTRIVLDLKEIAGFDVKDFLLPNERKIVVDLLPPKERLAAGVRKSWPWSSARAHLSGRDDVLCRAAALLERAERWLGREWAVLLAEADGDEALERFRRHGRTGRPLGEGGFVARLRTPGTVYRFLDAAGGLL